MKPIKTNFALAAIVPTADPKKGSIIHVCFYENEPQQNDVNSLVEELRTDEEFHMTDKVCDVDYFLHFFSGEVLDQLKKDMGVPNELDESTDLVAPEDFTLAEAKDRL